MAKRRRFVVCNVHGCPEYTDQGGRCADHRRAAEQKRGSTTERGYGKEHRERFRPGVLARDPICRCPGCNSCTTPSQRCARASEHADHWPIDKRTLMNRGMDSNDPVHGRGLCRRCHSSHTAVTQPGGFNAI